MKDLNRLRHSWLLCLPLLLNTQAAIAQDQFVDLQSNGGYTSYRLPDDKEKAALLDLAGRLKALPASRTCVNCQAIRDGRRRQAPHPGSRASGRADGAVCRPG